VPYCAILSEHGKRGCILKHATSSRRPLQVSLTPNPVSSRSGSDANMTLSSEDLFGRQHQTWAPDWVQTMILKNIRETIKAKMQLEHRFREDRREGFTHDWAAVAAEVQSQISSRTPTRATPRIQSQTPGNLGIGALVAPLGNPFHSQETVTSFDFSQTARLAPTCSTPRIQSQTPSTLGIGALVAPRVTNSIHKKRSRPSISARQQRDS